MRNEPLGISFCFSVAAHLVAVLLATIVVQESQRPRRDLVRVDLIETQRRELPPPKGISTSTPQKTIPPAPALKANPPKPEIIADKAPAIAPVPVPAPATPPASTIKEQSGVQHPSPNIGATRRAEGGGSEAGGGTLSDRGTVGIIPGPGTAGGGGGTAVSGLGRGAGPPGLPGQSIVRSNREAKPIQTVRAHYPPMALRAGLESDVMLKIEIDPEGKVTKAEIIKSGGAGFDEEALKAVTESRFEPAQHNGQNIPAEFTFVYRFRLRR